MNATSGYGTIVGLNAEAIGLMKQERYNEASMILQNAIEIMRHLALGGSETGPKEGNPVEERKAMPCSTTTTGIISISSDPQAARDPNNRRLFDSVPLPSHNSSSSLFNTGMFPFFNRALVVNIDVEEAKDFSQEALSHRLLAVLLYNTALIHHTHGVQTGSSLELSKALSFYQGAFMSVSGIWDTLANSDSLLILALLNDMGHIRATNLDRKEACCCLNMLRQFFSESNGMTLVDDEAMFFYVTAFIFTEEPLAVSPAA